MDEKTLQRSDTKTSVTTPTQILFFTIPDRYERPLSLEFKFEQLRTLNKNSLLLNADSIFEIVYFQKNEKQEEVENEIQDLKIRWLLTSRKDDQKGRTLNFANWVTKPLSYSYLSLNSFKTFMGQRFYEIYIYFLKKKQIQIPNNESYFLVKEEEGKTKEGEQTTTSFLFGKDFPRLSWSARDGAELFFEIFWILEDLWNSYHFMHLRLRRECFLRINIKNVKAYLFPKIYESDLSSEKWFLNGRNGYQLLLRNCQWSQFYNLPNKSWKQDLVPFFSHFTTHPVFWLYEKDFLQGKKMINFDFYATAMVVCNEINDSWIERIYREVQKKEKTLLVTFLSGQGLPESSAIQNFIKSSIVLLIFRQMLGTFLGKESVWAEVWKEFEIFCESLQNEPGIDLSYLKIWNFVELEEFLNIYCNEVQNTILNEETSNKIGKFFLGEQEFIPFVRFLTQWETKNITFKELLNQKLFDLLKLSKTEEKQKKKTKATIQEFKKASEMKFREHIVDEQINRIWKITPLDILSQKEKKTEVLEESFDIKTPLSELLKEPFGTTPFFRVPDGKNVISSFAIAEPVRISETSSSILSFLFFQKRSFFEIVPFVETENKNLTMEREIKDMQIRWIMTQETKKNPNESDHWHFANWIAKINSYSYMSLTTFKESMVKNVKKYEQWLSLGKHQKFFPDSLNPSIVYLLRKEGEGSNVENLQFQQKAINKDKINWKLFVDLLFEIFWLLADLWNTFRFMHLRLRAECILVQQDLTPGKVTHIYYQGDFWTTKKKWLITKKPGYSLLLKNCQWSHVYKLKNESWNQDLVGSFSCFTTHPIFWFYEKSFLLKNMINFDFYATTMLVWNQIDRSLEMFYQAQQKLPEIQSVLQKFFQGKNLLEEEQKAIQAFLASCVVLFFFRKKFLFLTTKIIFEEFEEFCKSLKHKEGINLKYVNLYTVNEWVGIAKKCFQILKNSIPEPPDKVALRNTLRSKEKDFFEFFLFLSKWETENIAFSNILNHKFFASLRWTQKKEKENKENKSNFQYFKMSPHCFFAFRNPPPRTLLEKKWKIRVSDIFQQKAPPQPMLQPPIHDEIKESPEFNFDERLFSGGSLLRSSLGSPQRAMDFPIDPIGSLSPRLGSPHGEVDSPIDPIAPFLLSPELGSSFGAFPRSPEVPLEPLIESPPMSPLVLRSPLAPIESPPMSPLALRRSSSRSSLAPIELPPRSPLELPPRSPLELLPRSPLVPERKSRVRRETKSKSKKSKPKQKNLKGTKWTVRMSEKEIKTLQEKATFVVEDEKKRGQANWKVLNYDSWENVQFKTKVSDKDKSLMVIWNLLNLFAANKTFLDNVHACRAFARSFHKKTNKTISFYYSTPELLCAIVAEGKKILHIYAAGGAAKIEETVTFLLENKDTVSENSFWRLYINPDYLVEFLDFYAGEEETIWEIQPKSKKGPLPKEIPTETLEFKEWLRTVSTQNTFVKLDLNTETI